MDGLILVGLAVLVGVLMMKTTTTTAIMVMAVGMAMGTEGLWADSIEPIGAGGQWARFDPALGTLTDVWLTVSSLVGYQMGFDYTPGHTGGGGAWDTVSGQVTGVLSAQVKDGTGNPVYSLEGERLFHGITGVPGTLNLYGVVALSREWTEGMGVFEGEGDWGLGVTLGTRDLFVWWPDGVRIVSGGMVGGMVGGGAEAGPYVTVRYDYEPAQVQVQIQSLSESLSEDQGDLRPTVVPEPGMGGVILVILAVLVGIGAAEVESLSGGLMDKLRRGRTEERTGQ